MTQKITTAQIHPEKLYKKVIPMLPVASINPATIKRTPFNKRNLLVETNDIYKLFVSNPQILNALLSDASTTLLLFLWLDLSEAKNSVFKSIQALPQQMHQALKTHNLINKLHTPANADTINTKAYDMFGPCFNFCGDLLFTNTGNPNAKSSAHKYELTTVADVFNTKRSELATLLPQNQSTLQH